MNISERLRTQPTDVEGMIYVVSLSGGKSSAIAADRVISTFGKERTKLWFADTLWEDQDLYRFLDDLERYWGIPIVRTAEGRKPLQVAEDRHIIPHSRIAPCSIALKVQPFTQYILSEDKPLTVCLGFDFTEWHRIWTPMERYNSIRGVRTVVPLLWSPMLRPIDYNSIIEGWGIEVPRLYKMGFNHNNCGGRCVRQGLKEWKLLHKVMPERFEEVASWERKHSQADGPTKDHTMLSRERQGQRYNISLYDALGLIPDAEVHDTEGDDRGSCYCTDI